MRRSKGTVMCLLVLTACASAQTTPDATQPAPNGNGNGAATAPPIEFSGLVDAYYSLNFNHPASRTNVIRNFDTKANQFSLNFAKFTMEHTPDPVGFKLELAAGRAMDLFHATEPAGSDIYRYLLQAYVSVRPASMKGFQLDVGKFVTSAGAEVTETHLNWNYSRSLLYALGPYYHFGARATMPLNTNFSVGAQLINGWNNVEDNNSKKTVGFTTALTTRKINWYNTYYVGNEKTDVVDGVRVSAPGKRHFYDTVVNVLPSGKVSGLFNFDYGVDKNPGARNAVFYGASAAVKFQASELIAFSPRYDWYKDRDGFMTGRTQTLQEFTMTGDIRLKEGLLTRMEFRRDYSNVPYFDRGNELASAKAQNTVLVGFIVYFGQKR